MERYDILYLPGCGNVTSCMTPPKRCMEQNFEPPDGSYPNAQWASLYVRPIHEDPFVVGMLVQLLDNSKPPSFTSSVSASGVNASTNSKSSAQTPASVPVLPVCVNVRVTALVPSAVKFVGHWQTPIMRPLGTMAPRRIVSPPVATVASSVPALALNRPSLAWSHQVPAGGVNVVTAVEPYLRNRSSMLPPAPRPRESL